MNKNQGGGQVGRDECRGGIRERETKDGKEEGKGVREASQWAGGTDKERVQVRRERREGTQEWGGVAWVGTPLGLVEGYDS